MKDILVLIDNGHGAETPGKCSPDRSLREWKWTREFASLLDRELSKAGINSMRIVPEESDVPIKVRCGRVNAWCSKRGAEKVLLVSIHCNAGPDTTAAYDTNPQDVAGYWKTARGFSVYVSKNASNDSKRLAKLLTDEAIKDNLMGNRSIPHGKYWTWPKQQKSDIALLKLTRCPAVLTENLFQDNREDVKTLLSNEGKQRLLNVHIEAIKRFINS